MASRVGGPSGPRRLRSASSGGAAGGLVERMGQARARRAARDQLLQQMSLSAMLQSYEGIIRRADRKKLGRLVSAFERRDLDGAMVEIRSLEASGFKKVPPAVVGRVFTNVCTLATEQGKNALLAESCVKIFENGEAAFFDYALNGVAKLSSVYGDAELAGAISSDLALARRLLIKFALSGPFDRQAFKQMTAAERSSRASIVMVLEPEGKRNGQLVLFEELYNVARSDEDLNGAFAFGSNYLYLARRLAREGFTEFDQVRLRSMADYCAYESEGCYRNHEPETLINFVMGLEYFSFTDHTDHVLAVCQIEPAAPLRLYARLSRLLHGTPDDVSTAYQMTTNEVDAIATGDTPCGEIVSGQVLVLSAEIQKKYLESLFAGQGLKTVGTLREIEFPSSFYSLPRGRFPDILAKMDALRKRIFSELGRFIFAGHYVGDSFSLLHNGSEMNALVFMLRIPTDKCLNVYLVLKNSLRDFDFGGVVKLTYRAPDPGGKGWGYVAASKVAGLATKDSMQAPIGIEYFTLIGLLMVLTGRVGQQNRSQIEPLVEEFREIMHTINRSLVERNFRDDYRVVRTEFDRLAHCQEADIVDLALTMRTGLAQTIVEDARYAVADAEYPLGEADFLFPIIERVDLATYANLQAGLEGLAETAEKLLPAPGEVTPKFPFGVAFRTKIDDDRPILGLMTSSTELTVLGSDAGPEDNFHRFLTNLALEAVVRSFVPEARSRESRSASERGVGGSLVGTGLAAQQRGLTPERFLQHVYARVFHAQLSRGANIWNKPWHTRIVDGDEVYYLPLRGFPFSSSPDAEVNQSVGNKRRALKELGPENIYISPLGQGIGHVVVLPVMPRVAGDHARLLAYSPTEGALRKKDCFGSEQALPVYSGLFVLSHLQSRDQTFDVWHAARIALRKEEDEIWDLLDERQPDLDARKFDDIDWLTQSAIMPSAQNRRIVRELHASGQLAITSQALDVSEVNTTFRLPIMFPLTIGKDLQKG